MHYLSISLALFHGSWTVIRTQPRLLVFPVLSGLASMLVFATYMLPFASNLDWFVGVGADGGIQVKPLTVMAMFAGLFVYYFASFFVMLFFNAALVSCVHMRFNGEQPTLEKGLRAAVGRLPQILGWALVSASVGMLLKMIEGNRRIGKVVSAILGLAWTVITYFVLPVLVVEGVGPIAAVKRSVAILKQTWKEGLAGHVGIGLVLCILWSVGGFPFLGFGVAALFQHYWVAGGVLVGIGILYSLAVAAFGSALSNVFRCALYHYATTGEVPGEFSSEALGNVFGS